MTAAAETVPASTEAKRSPGFLHALGGSALDIGRDVRDILQLLARTTKVIMRGRFERQAVLEQMHQIGNESVFFITVTMGFIGMILVFQSALQALKIVPDLTLLGATFAEILFRDLAPRSAR